MVFNLEVDGEHVYCVASGGLLIHNSCMSLDQIALKELVELHSGLGNHCPHI